MYLLRDYLPTVGVVGILWVGQIWELALASLFLLPSPIVVAVSCSHRSFPGQIWQATLARRCSRIFDFDGRRSETQWLASRLFGGG